MYLKYSKYLTDKYGVKVYKLPVVIPVTCPNRDGNKGVLGCTFCGEKGAGFESLPKGLTVKEQVVANKEYMGKRYKASKFIAYFQNYTNTYLPVEEFKKFVEDSIIDDVVEVAVSTRPDCLEEKYLDVLEKISIEKNVEITVELGLQSANYHSLIKVNRGHTLAEFIDASIRIKAKGFKICAHVIVNLPWDNMIDVVETAKIINALNVDFVKLHALYIVKETVMAKQFEKNEITIISLDEYKQRVITFLQHLKPEIAVQRIIGRAPKEDSVFCNWGVSWWKIRDDIEALMEEKNFFQGQLL